MNYLDASFDVFIPKYGDEYKHIERIGRVCYKSEDKITEDGESAKKFVNMLTTKHHMAMIEHASLIFRLANSDYSYMKKLIESFVNDQGYTCYLHCTEPDNENNGIISGNLRAWYDTIKIFTEAIHPILLPKVIVDEMNRLNKVFDSLLNLVAPIGINSSSRCISEDELSESEKSYHQYTSVKFICDRGVSHEIVRHRPASFAQESTRYCNYSKEKFGNGLNIINITKGLELDKSIDLENYSKIETIWEDTMTYLDIAYKKMIEAGATPQMARSVLPNSVKTEITMTANRAEWEWFCHLRDDDAAHPQMRELAHPLHQKLLELGRISK